MMGIERALEPLSYMAMAGAFLLRVDLANLESICIAVRRYFAWVERR